MTLQQHSLRYSRAEEIANSVTHGVGVVLSIAGLAVLTAFASAFGSVWHIVSCSIYFTHCCLCGVAYIFNFFIQSVCCFACVFNKSF